MNRFALAGVCLLLLGCDDPDTAQAQTLAEARNEHQSRVSARADTDTPVEAPPGRLFKVVAYPAEPGPLAAYITPDPRDGVRHPAIIWMTGGDTSTIGDVWSASPAENDQTARAFRDAGVVMMFPSLRGGNQNPGDHEGNYGEVRDVLAAAAWLAQQDYVDPNRIYLGGHSTGGTLALLTSELPNPFRAVFAFGPVGRMDNGYAENLGVRFDDQTELDLRSPGLWLGSITHPTFVFEGDGMGNVAEVRDMASRSTNPQVAFFTVRGADHFSILSPTTRLIARKVVNDTGAETNLAFTQSELDAAFRR